MKKRKNPKLANALPTPWQCVRTNDAARRMMILAANGVEILTIQISDFFDEADVAELIVKAVNKQVLIDGALAGLLFKPSSGRAAKAKISKAIGEIIRNGLISRKDLIR